MISLAAATTLLPLFVGQTMFLVALLAIVFVGLLLARIVLKTAIKIIFIVGAIILGLFIVRLITANPPV